LVEIDLGKKSGSKKKESKHDKELDPADQLLAEADGWLEANEAEEQWEEEEEEEQEIETEVARGKKRPIEEVDNAEEEIEIEGVDDVTKSIGKSCRYDALKDDEADDEENFKDDEEEESDKEQAKVSSEPSTPWDFLGWGSAGKAVGS